MSRDEKSSYYDAGGIETLDIIRAKLTKEQFKGYLLGNALKYSCRVNFKHASPGGQMRDAEKAANYTRWFMEAFGENQALEENGSGQAGLLRTDMGRE